MFCRVLYQDGNFFSAIRLPGGNLVGMDVETLSGFHNGFCHYGLQRSFELEFALKLFGRVLLPRINLLFNGHSSVLNQVANRCYSAVQILGVIFPRSLRVKSLYSKLPLDTNGGRPNPVEIKSRKRIYFLSVSSWYLI